MSRHPRCCRAERATRKPRFSTIYRPARAVAARRTAPRLGAEHGLPGCGVRRGRQASCQHACGATWRQALYKARRSRGCQVSYAGCMVSRHSSCQVSLCERPSRRGRWPSASRCQGPGELPGWAVAAKQDARACSRGQATDVAAMRDCQEGMSRRARPLPRPSKRTAERACAEARRTAKGSGLPRRLSPCRGARRAATPNN